MARHCPLFGSQILTGCWESLEPLAIRPILGCQSTERTSAPWPVKTRSSILVAKSQTLAVLSSDPVTNLASVGAKL